MSKAKVHWVAGLFGKAACGKRNVDTTEYRTAVTCASCKKTKAYNRT